MTPKNKADELIGRFLPFAYTRIDISEEKQKYNEHENARQCALICAEEIIKEIPMYTGNLNPKWEFWNEVRKEIKNL